MDSNYKDYVLKELDNLVSQIVEASEFKASESYRGLVESLQRQINYCLLYTSPSPRDRTRSRMPSSA